ncbi:hypothetical protein NC653_009158 [Populus alba x Populus x berolinensis]|uniref:Uncharacterized protein n=1 Tax=Populus alba x Populus x berolinensis TaxID=444605 RepID=A0AAD6R9G2_9ROSI|nr:hypothetical protein NC653_009158 [Populus alba x Populus x berolinensis]
MLEDLMFPWTNFPPFSAWIRAMPLAAPIAILILVSQSRGIRSPPLFPAKFPNASDDICNSKSLTNLHTKKTVWRRSTSIHHTVCLTRKFSKLRNSHT